MNNHRVIAVCGKGGVGKTAFTTLLTKVMIEDPQAGKLLVVDADPALGLHYALGRKEIKTIGTVRDEILRVAEEGDRQAQEELADKVDYLTARVLDEGKDFSFLAMGHMESKGCFCSVNDLLQQAISYLTNEFNTEETAQTAGQDKDTFSIYQIKGGDETRDFRFEPYDRLQAAGNVVDRANYELVYSAPLAPETSLEDIYTCFNIDHPKDFKGHSLSVSDVVVLHQDGQDAAHFVDSVGFREVPEFLQEQKQLTPDDLETGETVKTPRGTFHVTAMSREQIEAAGYGFHHQSDDGKYLIMGNGTRAFAVAAEQAQRDNPLKTAEQTTEQNGNMIDGIINNTPTVDELEAKVKAGEQISLVDLANAVKADKERGKGAKPEKKPSIRAQLRADKEKAQKKNAKQKSQDLERS